MFTLVIVGVTVILVTLGRRGSALWYILAAPIGFIAMISTFVSSLHLAMDGEKDGKEILRPIVCILAWLSATAIFVFLGQRGTAAWYLLAVPSGLFSAFCIFIGILSRVPPDPAAKKLREAKLYNQGWRPCPGCGHMRAPPIDPSRCHGCGKLIDHKAQTCVCGDCYGAHLTSN